MSKKTWAIVAVVLAGVLALGFSIPALAEEPDEVSALSGPGFMVRGRFWGGSWDLFDTIADLFGLDPTELFEKLHEGQTIEEIAEELGVDTQEMQETLAAKRADGMRERIEEAVEDGTMDEDRAEWLLEGLDNGFLDGAGRFAIRGMRAMMRNRIRLYCGE